MHRWVYRHRLEIKFPIIVSYNFHDSWIGFIVMPHMYSSYLYQTKVPSTNLSWMSIDIFDTAAYTCIPIGKFDTIFWNLLVFSAHQLRTVVSIIFLGTNFRWLRKKIYFEEVWFRSFTKFAIQAYRKLSPLPTKSNKIGTWKIIVNPQLWI